MPYGVQLGDLHVKLYLSVIQVTCSSLSALANCTILVCVILYVYVFLGDELVPSFQLSGRKSFTLPGVREPASPLLGCWGALTLAILPCGLADRSMTDPSCGLPYTLPSTYIQADCKQQGNL